MVGRYGLPALKTRTMATNVVLSDQITWLVGRVRDLHCSHETGSWMHYINGQVWHVASEISKYNPTRRDRQGYRDSQVWGHGKTTSTHIRYLVGNNPNPINGLTSLIACERERRTSSASSHGRTMRYERWSNPWGTLMPLSSKTRRTDPLPGPYSLYQA